MQHGHCGCEVVRNAVGVQSHCPRTKIEATASDGAENATEHFVTSFLVFWQRKGGTSKETPLMREYTMLSIGEQLVLETYKGMGSTFKIQC